MKGILKNAFVVTLLISSLPSFSMMESFKNKAALAAQTAKVFGEQALAAGKAHPYVAASIGAGVLGAVGLGRYAYGRYKARQAEARNFAFAQNEQSKELNRAAVLRVKSSVEKAREGVTADIFKGKNNVANMQQLGILCNNNNLQADFADLQNQIAIYGLLLQDASLAQTQKGKNVKQITDNAEVQFAVVISLLDAIETKLVNTVSATPVVTKTSKVARVVRWTGLSALAAGAVYGACKLWNMYRA